MRRAGRWACGQRTPGRSSRALRPGVRAGTAMCAIRRVSGRTARRSPRAGRPHRSTGRDGAVAAAERRVLRGWHRPMRRSMSRCARAWRSSSVRSEGAASRAPNTSGAVRVQRKRGSLRAAVLTLRSSASATSGPLPDPSRVTSRSSRGDRPPVGLVTTRPSEPCTSSTAWVSSPRLERGALSRIPGADPVNVRPLVSRRSRRTRAPGTCRIPRRPAARR